MDESDEREPHLNQHVNRVLSPMANEAPLVTVLVPVRNGASTLARALATVRAQTYQNLEIILSDNDSSDATPEIMKAFAAADTRARYVRHSKLPVLEHFSRLIHAAKGKYLLICAADDERNEAYVESLVESLERDSQAVLAFGRLVVSRSGLRTEVPFRFENNLLPRWRRVGRSAWRDCYHFYGLWRTSVLQAIRIRECTYWPDMQIMMSANCRGTFVRNDDAVFIYHVIPKTNQERAQYQSYKPQPLFFQASVISTSAMAIIEAGAGVEMALWGASLLGAREVIALPIALLRPRHRLRQATRAIGRLGGRLKAATLKSRASAKGA